MRSRSNADSVIRVARIVGRIGHIVNSGSLENESSLVAAVPLPVHELPRLRGPRNEARLPVESGEVFLQPYDPVLAESVPVAVSVLAEIEVGRMLRIVVDENVAVDRRKPRSNQGV